MPFIIFKGHFVKEIFSGEKLNPILVYNLDLNQRI